MSRTLFNNTIRTLVVGAAFVGSITSAQAAPVFIDEVPAQQRTVTFHDLNLNSVSGTEALYDRLQSASRSVCSALRGAELRKQQQFNECYRQALNNAIATVNDERVTALHTRSAPAKVASQVGNAG